MSEGATITVTDADFDKAVVEESKRRPVIVDFWAAWCGPCRMLGPIIEKAVSSYGGRVLLAKVNVDENPASAGRFGISSIPAVKMFRDGTEVDEFVGAQPEPAIREFIERNLPSPAADALSGAAEALEKGNLALAKSLLEEARRSDPASERLALLEAVTALAEGNPAAAGEAVSRVDAYGRMAAERKAIEARIAFIEECRAMEEKRKEEKPIDRLFTQANCLAAEGEYRQALDLFLRALTMDKNYREGAAKQAMLRVFEIVGKRSPLADEFRDKMAKLLY